VRLLHIADCHLGAACGFAGAGADAHRRRLEAALQTAVRTARERNCHLMLVAGDLFDSHRPSERLLQWAMNVLGEAEVPVCILPGTHDLRQGRSPYAARDWSRCPNLHLFTEPEPRSAEFPALGLVVHGRATPRGESPLGGLIRNDDFRWNVAVAHGGLLGGPVAEDSHPLTAEEIRRARMDYLALGHWHSWRVWREDGILVCYPGAPEPLAFNDSDTGGAALVTLDDSVTVERVKIGAARAETLELRAEAFAGPEDLLQNIAGRADPNLLLQVRLTGLPREDCSVDAQAILDSCAGRFAALAVDDLTESLGPESEGASEGIAAMLKEQVARELEEGERSGDQRRVRVLREALRLGLAALEGREVI